jgi:hypothetical protein
MNDKKTDEAIEKIYSKEDIEKSFNRAFDFFPEIEKDSVVLDFGVSRFTKHAQVFDLHSKRYIVSRLLWNLPIEVTPSLAIFFFFPFNKLSFLSYLFLIPVILAFIKEIDDWIWQYRTWKKHGNKFVIRLHEKLRTKLDLDFVMFHEFSHVLCCMGIVRDRLLFFREEGICDRIAEKRLKGMKIE